jgi:hypothetical protein
MAFQSLLQKYKTLEQWLVSYSGLYWYQVDYYEMDSSVNLMAGNQSDYSFYLDKVINYFSVLPKKTIPARILSPDSNADKDTLGYILNTAFDVVVPDVVLRNAGISVRVGDVVCSAGVFGQLANLKDFSQFTQPVFVRLVQSVAPRSFVLQHNNIIEWDIKVSNSDVIVRGLS